MRRYLTALASILTLLAILPAAAQAKTTTKRACIVPRLTGDTLTTARKRLEAAHCKTGTIHTVHLQLGETAIVNSENPKAGKREPNGKKIGLTFKIKSGPNTTTVPPAPTTPSSPPATTAPPAIRASIDPSYTQNPANPLQVTWTYSAGANGNTLPDGILSLTVDQAGDAGASGGCTINVGGTVTGGQCTVTLPAYGNYSVTVTYTDSDSSVAPATNTDDETISNPNQPTTPPAPTTTNIAATITSSTTSQNVGPPPTNLQSTNTNDAITATSNDPGTSQTCTWTITDATTGATVTDSTTSCQPYGLTFEQDAGSTTVNINPTTTFAGISFNQSDTVNLTVATSGSNGYTAATGSPITVWPA